MFQESRALLFLSQGLTSDQMLKLRAMLARFHINLTKIPLRVRAAPGSRVRAHRHIAPPRRGGDGSFAAASSPSGRPSASRRDVPNIIQKRLHGDSLLVTRSPIMSPPPRSGGGASLGTISPRGRPHPRAAGGDVVPSGGASEVNHLHEALTNALNLHGTLRVGALGQENPS
jgi:hypothetical protein